jgi:hypothetical protein
MNKKQIDIIEKEADRIATREYLARGIFGGTSKASGGIIVSRKLFDFAEAKRKAIVYLEKLGFKG